MSNGALTLCDVNGDVHTTFDKCVSLFIDGEKQSGVLSGETIAFSGTALGNICLLYTSITTPIRSNA